jgi:hypothetical protein
MKQANSLSLALGQFPQQFLYLIGMFENHSHIISLGGFGSNWHRLEIQLSNFNYFSSGNAASDNNQISSQRALPLKLTEYLKVLINQDKQHLSNQVVTPLIRQLFKTQSSGAVDHMNQQRQIAVEKFLPRTLGAGQATVQERTI